MEEQIEEWLESHTQVRQRIVKSEITKDKAGALPAAVYGDGSDKRLRFPEEIDIVRSNSVPQLVASIQFVDDKDVSEMDRREVQTDGFETCDERVLSVRSFVRLDL